MISITRSRLRASRARFALTISALTLLAVLLSAGPASAVYFSSIVSGGQAGSDQDHAFAFAAAPGESVTGINLRMTGGYWPHVHKVSARCSAEQAASASGCPAASRIASANAVFVAGAAPVFANGYVAIVREREGQIAAADAVLVLKPQGRQYSTISNVLKIRIQPEKGQPGFGLVLPQAPVLKPVNGTSANARLSALLINGLDSASGSKRWIRNPTSCDVQPVQTMVARLADGSAQTVTRTQSVTGCESLTMRAEVMFNPREYTLDKVRGLRLQVDLDKPAPGELRSDLRDLHVRIDTGHVDHDAISALPTCSDAELERDSCPSESRVGRFLLRSGVVADRFVQGEVWNQPPSKYDTSSDKVAHLGITLRNPAVGSGSGVGSGDLIWTGRGRVAGGEDGVVVLIDTLPQMDTNGIELELSSAMFVDDNNCQTATLTGVLTGWSGARRDVRSTVGWRCAPRIALTDPRDADGDGDGIADEPYRGASFEVPFVMTDMDGTVDGEKSGCGIAGQAIPGGSVVSRTVDADGDGLPDLCVVEGAQDGPLTLWFEAVDQTGDKRRIEGRWIVDTTPSQIETKTSTPRTTQSTSFGSRITVTDENGVAGVTCGVATGAGVAAGTDSRCADGICTVVAGGTGNPAGGGPGSGEYGCVFESDVEGLVRYEITASDVAGNKSTAFFDVFFDRTPPRVTPVDVTDADGDGVADQRFSTGRFDQYFVDSDDSFGDPELRRQKRRDCRATLKATPWKHHDIQAVDADGSRDDGGAGQSVCRFDGLEDGDWEILISVTDAAGNVGSATATMTVDNTAPVLAVKSYPFDPDVRDTALLLAQFDVEDANPGSSRCEVLRVEGESIDVVLPYWMCDVYALPDGEGCDPGDSSIPDCRRSFVLPHVLEQSGAYVGSITHTDKAGNSRTAAFGFEVGPIVSPTVSFPDAQSLTNQARPTIPFTITDGDPEGTTLCEVLPEVDDEVLVLFRWSCGGAWTDTTCDCSATPPMDLSDGNYRLRVTHHTRGSGDSTPETHIWTVDRTPPDVVFETFAGDPVVPGDVLLTGDLEPEATFTVSEQAKTECAIDTDPKGETPAADLKFDPCVLAVRVGPNAGDPSTAKQWCFRVRATDDAGNASDSRLCFTIAPPAPTVTIESPVNGRAYAATDVVNVNFAITGGAQPLHTWCYFDGRSTAGMFFDPCGSGLSKMAGSLGTGVHNVTVATLDALGRQASKVANFIVVTSTQPPDTCIAIYPPPPGCPGYPGTPMAP